jgi:hypothetical protein
MEEVEREMVRYEARRNYPQFIMPLSLQLVTSGSHCFGDIVCRVLL